MSRGATVQRVKPGVPYKRKGRKPAAASEALSARDRMAIVREERLAERGLGLCDRAASYAAMKPSTFRRPRFDLGGEGDAHTRNESEFWRLRELSRSMDRDDAVPGPVADVWLDLVLGGGGIQMDPQTGFPALNRAIKRDLEKQGKRPQLVDGSGRFTARMLERLALRHVAFDGDVLVVLDYETGKIQLLEGDRLAGSDGANGNVLHGVEVDPESGAIVAFYVLKRRPEARKSTGYRAPALAWEKDSDPYTRLAAFDGKGRPLALLVFDPKRVTETRGVTKLHRVFDVSGMDEDAFFATVAGLQGVSCIPMAITTTEDVKLGKREEADPDEDNDDGADAPPFEELVPNTIPRLRPGEALSGSPKAGPGPDAETFQKRIARRIAMQFALPYSLAYRDTSDTVFHGWRGEVEGAKRSAEWVHEYFPAQYCEPVYLFRLEFTLERLRKDTALASLIDQAEALGTLRDVTPQLPVFPYVDPKLDREADAFGIEHGTASPRATLAARGFDLDQVLDEFSEDVANAQLKAKRKAKANDALCAAEGLPLGAPDGWRAYCPSWALGVPLPGAPPPPPSTPAPPSPQPTTAGAPHAPA